MQNQIEVNLKKYFAKTFNIAFYGLVAILLFLKAPGFFQNFSLQKTQPAAQSLKRLSGEEIAFPIPEKKMVVIFWASWCGPCKLEMDRLNQMMSLGEIKSSELLAINMQEPKQTVVSFLEKHSYQFLVALDEFGVVANSYKVSGTPTVVFLDEKSQINWITTGLSPLLEFRVRNFLR